jgi:hypothetical protein
MARKLVLLPMLLLSMLVLQACGTTRTIETTIAGPSASKKLNKQTAKRIAEQQKVARCAGWQKLSYSGQLDTVTTTTGVRKHNQTGTNKGCW